ncbi:sensor domain CHASE2-containing protein [Mariprofundus aestuarium]|uniref:Sensor domain CHASE2-containing protein n=1 Tax=Mariprofundus aestuarium TaxID=1921086 RepID=A0A2K8KZF4_MARES|nr:CHASE2 domain-containing protein [Mariprofundus aestuarium]ATX80410.1 sensor domain CHASE2-containing protein [Mariprofundus aestuarium]
MQLKRLIGQLLNMRTHLAERIAQLLKYSFYLYLAGLFSIFAVLDATVLHVTSEMRQTAFDTMVRYRIVVPKPDPAIIIVDINEASLAAMAADYGRWPWPRQVLGEFLEQVEKQQPKAVVFDILFSDADIYNPDSDAYFEAAIAASSNTFFPMLRLDPASDHLSQIKPTMIPGVTALPDTQPDGDATMAIVLPHFQSAIDGGRLGLHNIYPDVDGVARRYNVYRKDYGWRLPTLPSRIASEFGWNKPDAQQVLLNWRGKPFTYHYVSFSDIFTDMSRKEKTRPQDEFRDKIVIIGSTAPSLFDIKATPMSRMFPGVEILATAIDNFKHDDALRFPEGRIWYLLITLLIIWLTAWGFYRNTGRDKIDRLFGLSQLILITITYASINLTNTYINLTGPVTVGLAFFTLARLYAMATGKALLQNMVRAATACSGELQATLLLIRLDNVRHVIRHSDLEKVRNELEKVGRQPKSVEAINGEQRGIWELFEHTLAISWIAQVQDQDALAAIQRDIDALLAAMPVALQRHLDLPDNAARHFIHRGLIAGGKAAPAGWRLMFAEALLEWDGQEKAGERIQ